MSGPLTFLHRLATFLRSVPGTVADGVSEVVDAVSPNRRKRRLSSSSATPSSASPPAFSEQVTPGLSALPPSEPPSKRRRISFPFASPTAPTPATWPPPPSAPYPHLSPFSRTRPPRFGRLAPTDDPSAPASVHRPRPTRPLNAQGLRSVLRSPLPPAPPTPAPYPSSPFARLPPAASLDLHSVFRYPTPRPRPSPHHGGPQHHAGTPRPLYHVPRRATFGADGSARPPHARPSSAHFPPTPSAGLESRRISLPPHPATRPTRPPRLRSLSEAAFSRSVAPPPPPYRRPLSKSQSNHKPDILKRLLNRKVEKIRVQTVAVAARGFAPEPRPPNGTVTGGALAPTQPPTHKELHAREAAAIFREHAGLDAHLLRANFPLELVELMEDNPRIATKIFKQHGPQIAQVVEAEVRKRRREREIAQAEQDRSRIRAKAEVLKGGRSLRKTLQRVLKNFEESEQPPADVQHFDQLYWSDEDEDWDEQEDETALAERKRKVTVTSEKSAYAPLTPSALKRLRQTMTATEYSTEQLANIKGCIITGQDLARLRPGVWLNDEVVNAYLTLLGDRNEKQKDDGDKENTISEGGVNENVPKVKVMNSFFYSRLVQFNRAKGCSVYDYTCVRRWTRRFDVFSYDMMLIPINQQNTHWTLGVVNFKEKWVQHLDSMGTGGSIKVREYLLAWLRDEAADKKKEFNQSEWTMPNRDVPKQKNSDDCGVFLCKFADFLCRGWKTFTFSQDHMDYFRSRIAHELLMGRVG